MFYLSHISMGKEKQNQNNKLFYFLKLNVNFWELEDHSTIAVKNVY